MAEVVVIPEPSFSQDIVDEAVDVLMSGKFLEYCHSVFSKAWLGDYHVLEAVLLATANSRIENTFSALHINVQGKTQVGKSGSVQMALKFLDTRDVMNSTMSKMYIFYGSQNGEIRSGMTILCDDTTLDKEIAALYRNVLTTWFEGTNRKTLDNQKTLSLVVPPRVTLIMTNVNGMVAETDDGQDESRFLVLEVTRTSEQNAAIRHFVQHKQVLPQHEMDVIHAVWTQIAREGNYVELHRDFTDDMPQRDFERFLSLIQSRALLNGRDKTTEEDYTKTLEFLTYTKPMIDSTTPAYTRNEKAVRAFLQSQEFPATANEISKGCKMPIASVYMALRGRDGNWETPKGGLMRTDPKLEVNIVDNVRTFKVRK